MNRNYLFKLKLVYLFVLCLHSYICLWLTITYIPTLCHVRKSCHELCNDPPNHARHWVIAHYPNPYKLMHCPSNSFAKSSSHVSTYNPNGTWSNSCCLSQLSCHIYKQSFQVEEGCILPFRMGQCSVLHNFPKS